MDRVDRAPRRPPAPPAGRWVTRTALTTTHCLPGHCIDEAEGRELAEDGNEGSISDRLRGHGPWGCPWSCRDPGSPDIGTARGASEPFAGGGSRPLTYERFDGAVDVLVLLEAGGRGEGLAAVWAGVGPGAHVLGADVPLQVAGVREHLGGRRYWPVPFLDAPRRALGQGPASLPLGPARPNWPAQVSTAALNC